MNGAVEDARISDRVRLLGYVPEADLPTLYHGARAFVFPSRAEGFGLPVLQALAAGLPTIASDIPALRELAGDTAIFIDPLDVEAWRNAFARIATDELPRTTLGGRGPARARQFSWGQCAARTWQAIQSLVQ